ncbi:MAG: hypothetical protein ACRCZW_05920, partial [Lactobacillaceae bacterium]
CRKSTAKPFLSLHHLGREFGYGTGQTASGLLSSFWTHLWPSLGLSKVYEKHFPFHPAGIS